MTNAQKALLANIRVRDLKNDGVIAVLRKALTDGWFAEELCKILGIPV